MTPEQRKRAILLAVVGTVLVAVIIYEFMPRSAKTADQGKPASQQGASAQGGSTPAGTAPAAGKKPTGPAAGKVEFKMSEADLEALKASVAVLDFDYKPLQIHRDPMKPLVQTKIKKGPGPGPGPEPMPSGPASDDAYRDAIRAKVVSGIVWDPADPCAVVDDRVVFVGAKFPLDITVVAIGPDYVTFRGGNVELPVRLKE